MDIVQRKEPGILVLEVPAMLPRPLPPRSRDLECTAIDVLV